MRASPRSLLTGALILLALPGVGDDLLAQDGGGQEGNGDYTIRQINAEPARAQVQMPNEPPTIRFEFEGSASGWLREDGTMHVESPVAHRGLLCGAYELGLRFGEGRPDCSNVEWLTPVTYLTRHQQCNSATVPHQGTIRIPEVRQEFPRVSCAQLVVRCKGRCQFSLEEQRGDDPSLGRSLDLSPSF